MRYVLIQSILNICFTPYNIKPWGNIKYTKIGIADKFNLYPDHNYPSYPDITSTSPKKNFITSSYRSYRVNDQRPQEISELYFRAVDSL